MKYLKEHKEFINEGLEELFDTKYFVMSEDEEFIYSDFQPISVEDKKLSSVLSHSFKTYKSAVDNISGRMSHYEVIKDRVGEDTPTNRLTMNIVADQYGVQVGKIWALSKAYVESKPKVVKFNLLLQKDGGLNI